MSYPTWSDLNNPSIVPPLGGRQAPDIGPAALMVSTEPDIRYISNTLGGLIKKPFFMGTLMTAKGNGGISIAGPYIGSPYAVMLMESLIAKGAQKIIVLGWCGSISLDLEPGDLVIPTSAISDEGTSHHYAAMDPGLPMTRPSGELSHKLYSHLENKGIKAHKVPIWTTDAIYRETPGKVSYYKDKGAFAVEMECSALFAAARFREIEVTALLVVSDSLIPDTGQWDPGFKKKQFKTMRFQACKSALEVAESLANDT